MKNVQIPNELFCKIILYFHNDEFEYSNEEISDLYYEIKSEVQTKMDRISMRTNYTAYKTAPTEEEREAARKKYIDERGVPESFRW